MSPQDKHTPLDRLVKAYAHEAKKLQRARATVMKHEARLIDIANEAAPSLGTVTQDFRDQYAEEIRNLVCGTGERPYAYDLPYLLEELVEFTYLHEEEPGEDVRCHIDE